MQVRRDDLLKAVELLSLIPQRGGIPASEYIKIASVAGTKKLNFYLSSDALGKARVERDGLFPVQSPYFVDRNLFMPFVNVAKNMRTTKDFEFEEVSGALQMKHGRRKILFPKLPEVTGYGRIEIDKDASELDLNQAQKDLIQCSESCATTDPIAPQLNCVYLTESGLVLSTNRVILFSAQTKKFDQATPMPLYLLKLLSIEGAHQLFFSKKQVVMKLDYGEVLQTVPQQALKSFPSKKILERVQESKKYNEMFVISAKKLADTLSRFGSYMSSVRRQDKMITLDTTAGKQDLTVYASASKVQMTETLRIESPAPNDSKAEWALDMVQSVIEFLGSQNKTITVSSLKDSPYMIDGGDVKLLVARKL